MKLKQILTAQEIETLFPMIDPPPHSSEESVNILASFKEWTARARVARQLAACRMGILVVSEGAFTDSPPPGSGA